MKAICMMTGAVIALSAAVPQAVLPVQATVREEAKQIQVKTPEEFIKTFLTEQITGSDGRKTGRLMEQVSETNYTRVLAGQSFLDSADPKLKKAIEDALAQKKIDWKAWCDRARELKQKLEPEGAGKEPAATLPVEKPEQTEGTAAGSQPEAGGQTTDQTPEAGQDDQEAAGTVQEPEDADTQEKDPAEEKPAGDSASGTKPAEDSKPAEDAKPADRTEGSQPEKPQEKEPAAGDDSQKDSQSTSAAENQTEDSRKPAVQQEPRPAQDQSAEDTQDAESSGSREQTGQEKPAQTEQPAAEDTESSQPDPALPQADPEAGLQAAEAARQTEMAQANAAPAAAPGTGGPIMPAAQNAAQSSSVTKTAPVSDAAQAFISQWLTSSQGNLYGAATSYNQSRILDAMPSWNSLSPQTRLEINQRLKSVTGKTYQKLVREAQQLKLGRPLVWNNTRVHTAASEPVGFFTGLITASAAVFVLLGQKLGKSKE
ncbi:hypothetical protein [uncultured Faecalibaculum sp.]|uniref:hypothetical protein n=1 Tax=uncultured Faecalibaculum sp. TaxID=1729681 RepID=UPI0026383D41|nr:hypothetical protein [uncultured Faecalibaculum sp.]